MDLRFGYCATCLKIGTEDDKLLTFNYSLPGEVTSYSKLIFCVSEMILENLDTFYLCKPCSAALETTFTFKSMCLNNIKKLRGFKAQVIAAKAQEETTGRIQLDEIPTCRTPNYDSNKSNSEKMVQTEELQSTVIPTGSTPNLGNNNNEKTLQIERLQSTSSSNSGNQNIISSHDGGSNNLPSFDINSYSINSNSFDFIPQQKKKSTNGNSQIESVKNDLDNLLSVSLAGSSCLKKSTSKHPHEKIRSEHSHKQRKKSLSAFLKKSESKKANSTVKKVTNTKLSDEEIIEKSCKEIPDLNNCSPTTLKCAIMLDKVDLQSSPNPNPKQQENDVLQKEVGNVSSVHCIICKKTFIRDDLLMTHMLHHHIGMTPFRCNECEKCFYCRGTLIRHYKKSHKTTEYLKYNDEMKEMTDIALDIVENYLHANDIKMSNNERLKKLCIIANQQNNVKTKFRHLGTQKINSVAKKTVDPKAQSKTNKINKVTRGVFTCKVCGVTNSNRGDHMRHKRLHIVGNKQPNVTTEKPQSLDGEVQSKVNKANKLTRVVFTCKVCRVTNSNRGDHMRHNRLHLVKNKSSNATSKKPQSIDHEAQSETNKANKLTRGVFTCKVCEATNSNRGDHMRHRKSHMVGYKQPNATSYSHKNQKKKYKYFCPICVNGFSSSDHKYTHTGEKPYKCTKCDARFRARTNLYAHTQRHSKENKKKDEETVEKTKSSSNEENKEPETDLETMIPRTCKLEFTENEFQMDVCQNVTEDSTHIQAHPIIAWTENNDQNEQPEAEINLSSIEENEQPESDETKCEFTEYEFQMDVSLNDIKEGAS